MTGTFVATAPTACGIETTQHRFLVLSLTRELQQHLPLAVLKLTTILLSGFFLLVATAPTACGIETTASLPSQV